MNDRQSDAAKVHLEALTSCIYRSLQEQQFAGMFYPNTEKRLDHMSKTIGRKSVPVVQRRFHSSWVNPAFEKDCNRTVYDMTEKVRQIRKDRPGYPMPWVVKTAINDSTIDIQVFLSTLESD